jgi:hypothetical protein
MNTRILILSTSIGFLSLAAFGFSNWVGHKQTPPTKTPTCQPVDNILKAFEEFKKPEKKETDFFYDFGTRFRPITKGRLDHASSFSDFVSEDEANEVDKYESVTVILIENDKQTDTRATTEGGELSKKQLEMLQSADYSTNFLVEAMYMRKVEGVNHAYLSTMTPYLTIVPEKQAGYEFGREGLLNYLKDANSENIVNLDESKLQPAKLYFTITKDGNISNVTLDRTSGYDHIDKTMIKLMSNTPGRWIPAENAEGEKVDQTLVVSFGMVGC